MTQAQTPASGRVSQAVLTLPAEIDMANAGDLPEPAGGPGDAIRAGDVSKVALGEGGGVADSGPATGPVVVKFPDEFDVGNAADVAKQLRAAITPGVTVVVADLTTTAFCDSSGLRTMLLARDWASADGVELRLAVSPGPALVALKLATLDELLPIYPSLPEALAEQAVPDADALQG